MEEWNVKFPKSKPAISNNYGAKSDGQTFTVLQLSDWHIDPDYQVCLVIVVYTLHTKKKLYSIGWH